jgi:hypothetical protein
MIKVDDINVYNFEAAIHGMRSPYNSYDKSDSVFHGDFVIGEKDLSLMQRLFKAGTEHRKFMRQILISIDITAPLYWWKQFDTYKVGTTANSQSTMHTIAKKQFELSDFSFDVENDNGRNDSDDELKQIAMDNTIGQLNVIRERYLETKDKNWWRFLIQLLPESYNQTRTVTMNYEVVANIIRQRRNHKLREWNAFIDILLDELPYLSEIMGEE